MNSVLVINADLGPLHRVSVKHAIGMLLRNVAEIHEAEPDRLIGTFPIPRVVRLVHYVVTRWRYTRNPTWSRGGVLARDGHRCGYCAGRAATIDHIVPRCRGGRNTWSNTVAACGACNQRKGDLTLEQARMRLLVTPLPPTWAAVVRR